jgi:hypothetical protein
LRKASRAALPACTSVLPASSSFMNFARRKTASSDWYAFTIAWMLPLSARPGRVFVAATPASRSWPWTARAITFARLALCTASGSSAAICFSSGSMTEVLISLAANDPDSAPESS